MPRFHLFRVRVERSDQHDLFLDDEKEPLTLIAEAVGELPDVVTGRGHHWHVGNLERVGDEGLYFKLGRVTKSFEDQWDEEEASFVEVEAEDTRATDVLLHTRHQVAGIAPNYIIGRTLASLGRKFRDLLNSTQVSEREGVRFFVSELNDPGGFLQQVLVAYAVTRFSFTAHRPNFPDAREFTRAMEEWVEDLDGDEGKAEVRGDDLDGQEIEKQTRATVSAGGTVSAKIRDEEGSRPRTVHLGDTPVVEEGDIDTEESRLDTLRRIVSKYLGLRDRGAA